MPKSSRESGFARVEHARTGIVEEAGFLDVDGERVFAVRHLPPRPADAGLVICCPVFAEFEKNYRREVPLARSLAAAGIAVQRFHYRGTGHSDDADTTFDTMLEDARLAARALAERAEVDVLAFMGTRLGALPAAAAAAEFPGGPLALWEPVVTPEAYFREIVRYRRLLDVRKGQAADVIPLVDELADNGAVEVVGYRLGRPLHDSMSGRALRRELGAASRPILLVQFGQPQRPLRAEYRALRDELAADGFDVETAVASLDEMWLFAQQWQPPERLLTLTAEWLRRRLLRTPAPA
ncbi:MAG TPA: alpha/beta hydrolase [Actinomycetota bacterium]|nr:alpha/beta hydrolase [Actinomycetota bacterium]